ncbi:MAG TPA: hypothetical protein VJ385_03670 [Fibrobacteria bacterium]|nr:hypothetical protein [Fibrobacteria bacterium]
MRTSRPLMAAAAAAGLLAAGCEYWKNLVDDKEVTKVPLTLVVRDAWTREPLSAYCVENERGIRRATDANGLIRIPEAGTGAYTFTCEAEFFYPGAKTFSLGGAGGSDTVSLARLGLEQWYPEDTSRQVRLPARFETLRFPPNFVLATLPKTAGSAFRYAWTFARNKHLDRPITGSRPGLSELVLTSNRPEEILPGKDTVKVDIYSALRGKDSLYLVASYSMPFEWVRNKLPVFTNTTWDTATDPRNPRVGCDADDPFIHLQFAAMDSDGVCKKAVFFTSDTNSNLKAVHEVRSCTDQRTLDLRLTTLFDSVSDEKAIVTKNKLYVEVWDDNNEFRRDSIEFPTRTNVRPRGDFGPVHPQSAYLTHSEIRLWVKASNPDDVLREMTVNYGDGKSDDALKSDNLNAFQDTVSHKYDEPGPKFIIYTVSDLCPSAFLMLDTLYLRDNAKPKLLLFDSSNGFSATDPKLYRLHLSVLDPDIRDGIDSAEMVVNWGEGKPDTLMVTRANIDNILVPHRYLTAPQNGVFYPLGVEVIDSQNALDHALRNVPAAR